MRAHRKLMVTIVLFAVALLALGGILVPLLAGDGGEAQVDLAHSSNPGDVIIQIESGGGPPPLWTDYLPGYRLFGDGTVIMQDPSTNKGLMVQGKISSDQVQQLLEQVKETGFFDLNADYGDDQIYDGSYTIITVQVASGSHQVLVYMTDVPQFTKARNAILDFPVGDVQNYVPLEGYLVVEPYTGGKVAAVEPGTDVYAALPDLAALAAVSGSYTTAVSVEGSKFDVLKRFESQQQYLGLLVHTDSGDLVVFPVYLPRSVLKSASS